MTLGTAESRQPLELVVVVDLQQLNRMFEDFS